MEIRLGEASFGLHDAWQLLTTIAEHKGSGEPFPSALPATAGCDFDAVKRFVCKFRLGALKSVDMVMPGRNGRFYFIEFKDVQRDRIAELRRKAFDSLIVFWLSFGKHLSMDEICANAEFVLVKPDSEREKAPSETFFYKLRQGAESLLPIPKGSGAEPLELQLQELTACGLYSQARVVFASSFGTFWKESIGSCDETTFVARMSRPLIQQRGAGEEKIAETGRQVESRFSLREIFMDASIRDELAASGFGVDSHDAERFCDAVRPLLEKREFKPEITKGRMESRLFVADAIQPESNRLFMYQNWNDRNSRPLAALVNRVFDGFFLWAWRMFANRPLNDSLDQFSMSVIFDGKPGPIEKDGKPAWVQQFLGDFLPWFSEDHFDENGRTLSFGLAIYRDDLHYYKDISTLPITSPTIP